MNPFELNQNILGDYGSYMKSFLNIHDQRIRSFVHDKLDSGILWPDPLIQLNPAYEFGRTVEELTNEGKLHPLCAKIFRDRNGRSFRLYRHQAQAIEAALRHESYVLTTGTGSGKSLAYLIPIFDHILKNQPEKPSTRALIIYPMNALINSQRNAIENLLENLTGNERLISFDRYTGQESLDEKQAIIDRRPHILLTNYMMLEYLLTRPKEHVFIDRAISRLDFLVLDELHTYTGRKGADVAMLIRRLRERCGNPNLVCIGTSATMASQGILQERAGTVARVATRIFGVDIKEGNVIGESLRPVTSWDEKAIAKESLQKVVEAGVPERISYDEFTKHPLAVWIEMTFGLTKEEGALFRRPPIAITEGARLLAEETGLSREKCEEQIARLMLSGSRAFSPGGEPACALKLHQFVSQGGAVYATVEPKDDRLLTLEAGYYAPGAEGTSKVLFPLVFCRECGQEYYRAALDKVDGTLLPRTEHERTVTDEQYGAGYVLIDDGEEPVWDESREDELPESWFNLRKTGRCIDKKHAFAVPRKMFVSPDGSIADKDDDGLPCWYLGAPFLFCPRCGVVYTKREREFRKLSQLSSEGRSTATTLISVSTILSMREDKELEESARKILSFTDNRQDASLQAGHFNDFVHIATLRAAIYKALSSAKELDHANIASAVVDALALPQEYYALEAGEYGDLPERNRSAFIHYIEYRIYEDLKRHWRVMQPGLEQCGLLEIAYKGLEEVAADSAPWQRHPVLAGELPERRAFIIRSMLDHLRRALAINAGCLLAREQEHLKRTVNHTLKEPWTFDSNELLEESSVFLLPAFPVKGRNQFSLGARGALGRFLRSKDTWTALETNMSIEEYERFLEDFISILKGSGFVTEARVGKNKNGIKLRADSMVWRIADKDTVLPDSIRSRWLGAGGEEAPRRVVNVFFKEFYRKRASELGAMEGREHTGQVGKEDRQDREERFRKGELECLYCSPTMELGIDIADLNMVHMRNVPRSSANYAQRSGRAGRNGQPALILTYSSSRSPHDQYFFSRRREIVSGVVVPPRFDFSNLELLQCHVQAVWLAATGVALGQSMTDVLVVEKEGCPLKDEIAHHIELSQAKLDNCLASCRRILESCGPEVTESDWYSEEWLGSVLRSAADNFDQACERWRELYRSVNEQIKRVREIIDNQHRYSKDEVDRAEREEREAKRTKDILCARTERWETDFYPYRYLASEGFLPGYNFPRMPVRLFLPSGTKTGEFLSRDRFLAIGEYGPRNVIYYEGRTYITYRLVLPPAEGIPFVRAKLCETCGYFHEGEAAGSDLCEHCNQALDGMQSKYTDKLLEMTTVRARPARRITCDEEERRRKGFFITSHFRFAPLGGGDGEGGLPSSNASSGVRRIPATVEAADGGVLLELMYGPSATLWRINRKWRGKRGEGFTINNYTGVWAKQEGDTDDFLPDAEDGEKSVGVYPFVRNTRNIMLVQVPQMAVPEEERDPFLATLQSALSRGIEAVFQVEEQELASIRIGSGDYRGILFWENAEGGIGVFQQIIDDAGTMRMVAEKALELCHFDPQTLASLENGGACSRACYRCLLSYTNQEDHRLIDRNLVSDFLSNLRVGTLKRGYGGLSYEAHYNKLRELTDARSELERKFLDHLYATRRRLPDFAQRYVREYPSQPDFYYQDGRACVFCDGSVHDEPEQRARDERDREALKNLGYRVVVIRYDRDMGEQVAGSGDVFGEGVR